MDSVVEANRIIGILERALEVDHVKFNFRNPSLGVITSENGNRKVPLLDPCGKVIMVEVHNPNSANVIDTSAYGMRYLRIEGRK